MIMSNMKSWRFAVVMELGDRCICGCRRRAEEVHHLISRRVKRHRLETLNGVPVARGCHGRPVLILDAVKEKCPERYAWYVEHKHESLNRLERSEEVA